MSRVDGVVLYSGSRPFFAHPVNRCRVAHTPAGIEASVPEHIVRERYRKIYRTYNRIRSALAGDCNEYLPIYRLHDDLMVEIWRYLGVLDRHHATQVSRRFRGVALDAARLWTFVNFNSLPSVPRCDTSLKRAGAAPLHIRVNNYRGLPPTPTLPLYGYPAPAPFNPFKPPPPPPDAVASIPRATVLDATFWMDQFPPGPSFQNQVEPSLKLEDLTMKMPLLRSLRLSMLPFMTPYLDNTQHPLIKVTEPLFGGHTPLLRHVALTQCNINWSDPLFRNLTYLLIRRPYTPFYVSRLV